MLQWLSRFDHRITRYIPVLFLLLLVVLLRLPNLTEPYWYGDEGIYLTIGTSLKQGAKLYTDIVDHKTPLIYYLAMVPNQMWFRVLLLAWMMVTTVVFYYLAKRITRSLLASVVGTVVFIAFTTLPRFEGNIPNGELFLMGWVLLAAYLATFYRPWQAVWSDRRLPAKPTQPFTQLGLVAAIGASLGVAVLIKVPALFDAIAVASIGWWSGWAQIIATLKARLLTKSQRQLVPAVINTVWPALVPSVLMGVGVVLMVVLSAMYFTVRGSLPAYLQFGLLYNFHYAGNWSLNLTPAWLALFFTLPIKALIVAAVVLVLTLGSGWLRPKVQWLLGWTMLALFACLLSNRPYPHYFLQLFPPVALLVSVVVASLTKKAHWRLLSMTMISEVVMIAIVTGLILASMRLIGVGYYPTVSYYQRFWQLATGQITTTQYQNSFNYIIPDNQKAANIIMEAGEKRLFIWGTNPMLYALSQTRPIGRFTVAFHIKDLKLEAETVQVVTQAQPKFIVVMNDEQNTLPELNEYLNQHYIANTEFDHFTLWKRL